MACLGSVLYDPGSVATANTTAALAMTAFDTTNARITFNAPANGIVLAKIRVAHKGGTNVASLLGVLEGSTVRGRQSPIHVARTPSVNNLLQHEATFLIPGLTPGNSYSFDAAYGVETLTASTQFGWGGPNNATANDAYGALAFEVWETTALLAGVNYDPSTAVSKNTATLAALTAIDTTNLRLAFTAPPSGRVLVRMRGVVSGATTVPTIHLGVLQSSTVKMRQAAWTAFGPATPAATDHYPVEACAVIDGLSGSLTWDAAWAVETVAASSGLKYGGPNNTTANDAWGGFGFEVWKA